MVRRRAAPRRGRRRTWGFITFVTLPAVLFGSATVAGAYGVNRLVAPPRPQCLPQVVVAPARGSFELRVFNGTRVDGTGASVGEQLTARGFRVAEVSNRSGLGSSAVEIAHGRDGLDEALLVAQQIPGAKTRFDGRAGSSVSAVLGSDYAGLVPVPPPPPPRTEQIVVNVYNATWRVGLAADLSKELRGRGFRVDKAGNDPRRSFLPDRAAVIRHGEDGEAAARVLAHHVPGAALVRIARDGATVDLVAGNGHTALTPPVQVPPPPPPPTPKGPVTVTRPCAE